MNNSASSAIERFKTDFRIEMYVCIEQDIGNKECKEIFENECEQRTEKLRENIRRRFEQDEKQFHKGIQKTIEEFEERIKNFLVMLNRINIDSGFDINIDTDSGINGLGLFSSIASLVFGIFNFWNFVGWAST
ncbi:hypothetical protein HpVa114_07810 [Helicobacter pylori]